MRRLPICISRLVRQAGRSPMGAAQPGTGFSPMTSKTFDDRKSAIDRRLPPSVRRVVALAVRIAATRDGAAKRCARRVCRKDGCCRADRYGHEGAVCTGGPSARAASEVEAMMTFLTALSLGADNPRKVSAPEAVFGRRDA